MSPKKYVSVCYQDCLRNSEICMSYAYFWESANFVCNKLYLRAFHNIKSLFVLSKTSLNVCKIITTVVETSAKGCRKKNTFVLEEIIAFFVSSRTRNKPRLFQKMAWQQICHLWSKQEMKKICYGFNITVVFW